MSGGDIGQMPACGMCGRPVHPHSMGIRYRGNVQCHGESTCISVLEQEIKELQRLLNEARKPEGEMVAGVAAWLRQRGLRVVPEYLTPAMTAELYADIYEYDMAQHVWSAVLDAAPSLSDE